MIKEITVFTNGDSEEISTWSNVPYFFTKTLMKKGVKINRVNIYADEFKPSLSKTIVDKYLSKILNRIYKRNNTYSHFRSPFHFNKTRNLIKKSVEKYPNSDVFLFLTFSFSAVGFTEKKVVQFGDWTYDYYLKYFANRKPNWFEKQSVNRENTMINGSDLSIALFPAVAEYMKPKYSTPIKYLGNVINAIYEPNKIELLELKKKSKKFLFIGSKKYILAARELISAFEKTQNKHQDAELHFIGLKEEDFENLPENVFCHGYLNKSDDAECKIYYDLVKNARAFVNTSQKWGSFSSSLEMMYFYTPLIIAPYQEFIETFGEDYEGGYFCKENDHLAEKLNRILQDQNYLTMCDIAHEAVKKFTWDSYVDGFLAVTEQIEK
jgi:hypothetical protein